MPYIPKKRRKEVLFTKQPKTAGELNFLLTDACLAYLNQHEENYDTLNSIIGALESAKQEFYRRLIAPYETQKEAENGDVYQ